MSIAGSCIGFRAIGSRTGSDYPHRRLPHGINLLRRRLLHRLRKWRTAPARSPALGCGRRPDLPNKPHHISGLFRCLSVSGFRISSSLFHFHLPSAMCAQTFCLEKYRLIFHRKYSTRRIDRNVGGCFIVSFTSAIRLLVRFNS